MQRIEKLLLILCCYLQAIPINLVMFQMLEGINALVFIIYIVWSWFFVPFIIVYGIDGVDGDEQKKN